MNSVFNPFTKALDYTFDASMVSIKESVASQANLPLSGNTESDLRVARDTDKMYVWSIPASSGLLSNWLEIGNATSIAWSAITGKPSSSVANIDDAVTKRHTQGTDAGLDTGGANAITASQLKTLKDITVPNKMDKLSFLQSIANYNLTLPVTQLMPSYPQEWTCEFWIKITGSLHSTTNHIFSVGADKYLNYSPSTHALRYYCGASYDYHEVSVTFNSNQWYHICIQNFVTTYENVRMTAIHIDGVQVLYAGSRNNQPNLALSYLNMDSAVWKIADFRYVTSNVYGSANFIVPSQPLLPISGTTLMFSGLNDSINFQVGTYVNLNAAIADDDSPYSQVDFLVKSNSLGNLTLLPNTETEVSDAITKRHSQNTDTESSASTFTTNIIKSTQGKIGGVSTVNAASPAGMARLTQYKLDDNAGSTTIVDAMGNYNSALNGANSNTVDSASGLIGGCFDIHGNSASEDIRYSNSALPSTKAFSFWFKHDRTGAGTLKYLLYWDKGGTSFNIKMYQRADNQELADITFRDLYASPAYGAQAVTGLSIAANVWHNLTFSADGTNVCVWLDGTSIFSAAGSMDIAHNVDGSAWFAGANFASQSWLGQIDNIITFSSGLDNSMASELYNAGAGEEAFLGTASLSTTVGSSDTVVSQKGLNLAKDQIVEGRLEVQGQAYTGPLSVSGNITTSTGVVTDGTNSVSISEVDDLTEFKVPYLAATGTTTLNTTHYFLDCTANTFSVNLPTAVGIAGRVYVVKNSGTGVITLDGNASETIDGAATVLLSQKYQVIKICSDGVNWKIIGGAN